MNIVIKPCGVDTDNITRLGDRPNTDNELSADQLKRVFDKTGADIKSFINESLLPDLERSFGEMDTALTKKPAGSGVQKAYDGELVDAVPGVDYQAPIEDGEITAAMLAEDAIIAGRLRFESAAAETASFAADSTYEDFPYRAAVALEGVTADMVPEVVFSLADAASGNFAPVAESYDGGVYIYAAEIPAGETVIPVITLWR
ncbi:MAG: hypothetical protein IIW40_05390 [Clostridia bacterium]|nr:hypothetical protein [Clostridia bacterium]